MESLSGSTFVEVPRYRTATNSRVRRSLGLIVGSVFAVASFAALATGPSERPRFELAGSGTLTLDQSVQKSGSVQLKAYLTPSDAVTSASPRVQEDGGFSLSANLAATSLVCYNDTIFRDDFDGDGF